MQKTGICYQAYIPMRREADSASEMVNQVLFGESFSILEEDKLKNFSHISLHHDSYEGWINSQCINYLSDKEWSDLKSLTVEVSRDVHQYLQSKNPADSIYISCGSLLRMTSSGKININGIEFSVSEIPALNPLKKREAIVAQGLKLLSIPYLWGGRSSGGFDCSGLVQNLYRQVGMEIPRDASIQSTQGKTLSFIAEAKPGDLAFFDNEEGKITHVGMIAEKGKVLHASGKVKIDELDHQGIFSKEQNRYTHKLRVIKNLIDA